jgi:bacteriorhodopsin
MYLLARTNDALKINPPISDLALTTGGSDWLWAITALYSFTLIVVVPWAFVAKSGEKIFHHLFTISLLVGAISYFSMASDIGSFAIETSENEKATRAIFWGRYINW